MDCVCRENRVKIGECKMHVSWELSDLLGRIFYVFSPDLAWKKKKKQNISCEQDISATENPHGRT